MGQFFFFFLIKLIFFSTEITKRLFLKLHAAYGLLYKVTLQCIGFSYITCNYSLIGTKIKLYHQGVSHTIQKNISLDYCRFFIFSLIHCQDIITNISRIERLISRDLSDMWFSSNTFLARSREWASEILKFLRMQEN